MEPEIIRILIEEVETGYYADMETYQILGAYKTAVAIGQAIKGWRALHYGNTEDGHAFEYKTGEEDQEGAFWCATCLCGVAEHVLTVED